MGSDRIVQAAGVVLIHDGAILLVQRGHEPQVGRWTLPGGRREPDETLKETASRELLEETGVTAIIEDEVGSLRIPFSEGTFDVHDFAASYVSGEPTAGDDAADVRWIKLSELDQLPLTQGLIESLTKFGVFEGR